MEFSDVIKSRTSVRDYSDKEVEEEKITYVLECARLAPSWMNKQSWRFIVIKNKETIALIAKKVSSTDGSKQHQSLSSPVPIPP